MALFAAIGVLLAMSWVPYDGLNYGPPAGYAFIFQPTDAPLDVPRLVLNVGFAALAGAILASLSRRALWLLGSTLAVIAIALGLLLERMAAIDRAESDERYAARLLEGTFSDLIPDNVNTAKHYLRNAADNWRIAFRPADRKRVLAKERSLGQEKSAAKGRTLAEPVGFVPDTQSPHFVPPPLSSIDSPSPSFDPTTAKPITDQLKEKTPVEIARGAFQSVVLIATQDAHGQPLSLASGFFVEKNVVATNFHVIEGAASGYVKLVGQNAKLAIEGIVGLDASRDLALLEIAPSSIPPLMVADSTPAAVGDTVFAIGNPRGLEGTFSEGIVSGVRQLEQDRILQITAPLSPGSSGGPVLDRTGAVIGISVASVANGQNLNFAIPAEYLKALETRKTEIREFRSIPVAKVNKTLVGQLGPQRDAVVVESFLYDDAYRGSVFSFSLRNQLAVDVSHIDGLLVFYDTHSNPIETFRVRHDGVLPAGVAERIRGQVDDSVRELNSPRVGVLLSPVPVGKIEFRLLDFTLIGG